VKDYLGEFLAEDGQKILECPQVPHPQNPQKPPRRPATKIPFEGFEGTPSMSTWKFFVPGSLPWEVGRRSLAQGREAVRARVEAFEERAAIMEFDGGLPREEAERQAWHCVGGEESS
jgi:hypothetical protein